MKINANNINSPNILEKRYENKKTTTLIEKLFVWSLILEPLLYFNIASGGKFTGITFSVSRILQIIVLSLLFFKFVKIKKSLQSIFTKLKIQKYFIQYLCLIIFATFFGALIFNSYERTFGNLVTLDKQNTPFLKSWYFRPIFDCFLLIYYYFYFIFLTTYFFKSYLTLKYFFKKFFLVFNIFLLLGFIDIIKAYFTGSALIKRHLGEDTDVGFRFHSFAGEPRDAFVFLLYSICLIMIYNEFYVKTKNHKILLLSFIALILTQSVSGILGILIGFAFTLFYFLRKLKTSAFYILGVVILTTIILILLIPYSPRIILYQEGFSELFDYLESGLDLPYILLIQSVNFLPIWGLYLKLKDLNLFQIFFGSGFSSSAYFNMNYIGDESYSNPNSQFTRLIFESGIFGFLIYLKFLTTPFFNLSNNFIQRNKSKIIIYFFLFLGATLAHRSLTALIFIGVMISINKIIHNKTHLIKIT